MGIRACNWGYGRVFFYYISWVRVGAYRIKGPGLEKISMHQPNSTEPNFFEPFGESSRIFICKVRLYVWCVESNPESNYFEPNPPNRIELQGSFTGLVVETSLWFWDDDRIARGFTILSRYMVSSFKPKETPFPYTRSQRSFKWHYSLRFFPNLLHHLFLLTTTVF